MNAPRAIALLTLTAALAACGSSASSGGANGQQPSVAHLSPPTEQKGTKTARSNEVDAGGQSVAAVAGTEGPGGAAASPCKLVTRAQARAIVGKPLAKPLQAPQGPTCIYRYDGAKSFITLAVQSIDAKTLKRQPGHKQQVEVSGKRGFCSSAGQSTLYVPLSARQVLSVAAPCQMAQQFAVRALRHLG